MKRIIVCCLVVAFLLPSMALAQTREKNIPEFSLKTKYNNNYVAKSKTDWPFFVLAVTYVTFSALDLYTTYEALSLGAKEANPFLAKIIHNKPLTIALKMGTTFLVTYIFYKSLKKNKLTTYILFAAITIGQAYIVYHNYQVIKRLRN